MSEPRHEIARIVIRHVRQEARFWRERNNYYPSCRGKKHTRVLPRPVWNIRFSYVAGGGGQSHYWCDECLPARYRTVADSMLRGKEKTRVLQGEALKEVAPRPRRKEPVGVDRIPWRQLL